MEGRRAGLVEGTAIAAGFWAVSRLPLEWQALAVFGVLALAAAVASLQRLRWTAVRFISWVDRHVLVGVVMAILLGSIVAIASWPSETELRIGLGLFALLVSVPVFALLSTIHYGEPPEYLRDNPDAPPRPFLAIVSWMWWHARLRFFVRGVHSLVFYGGLFVSAAALGLGLSVLVFGGNADRAMADWLVEHALLPGHVWIWSSRQFVSGSLVFAVVAFGIAAWLGVVFVFRLSHLIDPVHGASYRWIWTSLDRVLAQPAQRVGKRLGI